jgi:hypothetical protein
VLWTKPNVAVLIAAFVIVAERIATSFSRRLIEPTAWEYASSSLNSHHCGTGPGVLDRRFAT